jgi:hypothetical protein
MIDDLSQARERRQRRAFHRMHEVLRRRQEDESVRSPPRSFSDVGELLEVLRREHEYGRFAYRGQMARPDRFAGKEAIERLLPGDFRFFWRDPGHQQTGVEITCTREDGRDRRDRFFQFLRTRATAGDPQLAWLAAGFSAFEAKLLKLDYLLEVALYAHSIFDEPVFRVCWSLAQHYGIETSILDLTRSPAVAAWFATNPWLPDRPPPNDGTGVIYRFDVDAISYLLGRLNEQRRAEAVAKLEIPPTRMFVVDISSIPKSLACRPRSQRGLSLYGFDQIEAIQMAEFGNALEVFTFPHQKPFSTPLANRETLVPVSDPFVTVVEQFLTSDQALAS